MIESDDGGRKTIEKLAALKAHLKSAQTNERVGQLRVHLVSRDFTRACFGVRGEGRERTR